MLLSLTSLKEVTLLATLKIHSAYHKFFDKTEYVADFNNYHDILFYLQSMHGKFNTYIKQLTGDVDESFAFLDSKLNIVPIDSYHMKHIKEGDTVYLAPLIVGGGGKRGSFLLLVAAAFAAPAIIGAMGAGGAAASTVAMEGGAVAVSSVQGGLAGGGGLMSAFAKMPALARSFLGNMAISLVTSLFVKKPKKMETDQSTRQNGMFGNLTNTMESGTPIPLQYGLIRVAGQMLSGYVDSDQHGKTDIVKVEDKF